MTSGRAIDERTLLEMGRLLADEDRDEMAIPSLLHRNPALRWMAWKRVRAVSELILEHTPRGGRLLDFGCGTGLQFETALERAAEVVGVDLVLEAAALWKERRGLDRVRLLRPEEAATSIDHASVDTVVAAEVLEHVPDPAATLTMLKSWLRPGGRLIVSLPTENRAYRFGRRLAGFSGHFHLHNAATLDRAIQDIGFPPRRRGHIPMAGPLAIYLVAVYENVSP